MANIIDNSPLFNPRILIYPPSGVYVAYNFSANNSYIGAGFWRTLLKGDVYASYFNYKEESIEWYITNYSNYNDTKPLINAFQILGINYIILTKNVDPTYYFTGAETRANLFNLVDTMNNTLYHEGKKILFSNSQMTLYWFSNISLVSVVKYIIAINATCTLFNQNSREYQILTNALNISYINYSEAFLVSYKYLSLLYNILNQTGINYSIIKISPNITIIKLMVSPKDISIKLKGYYADYFTVYINNSAKSDLYIPLIIRYNYFPSNFINSNSTYYLIPGYSNETVLIIVKANNFTYINVNFANNMPLIDYYPLFYFVTIIFLSLYLIVRAIRKFLLKNRIK